MNTGDMILIAILVVAAGWALRACLRGKKGCPGCSGGCGCPSGCGGCSNRCHCGKDAEHQ